MSGFDVRSGMASSAGGARAAGGLTFQAQVFAWWAARAITNTAPGLGLDPRVRIESVGCETGFPVDDVGVALSSGGFILVQAKSGMRRLDSNAADLREALNQVVGAMAGELRAGVPMRKVDVSRDRLMIATNQDSSRSFGELGVVCARLRDHPSSVPIDAAATDEVQRRALKTFLQVVRSSWVRVAGREPTDSELRQFLSVVEVCRLDFEPDTGADRLRCATMLEHAPVAQPFSVLVGIGIGAARGRTWRQQDALRSAVGLGHPAQGAGELTAEAATQARLLVRLASAPLYLAGRDDLLLLIRERLTPAGAPGPRVVALCGLGGVGKTALALGYVHRHLSSYGLVWQLPASDPVSLSAAYAELAGYLGIRDLAAGSLAAVQEVHHVLMVHPDRWLLLLDDAPDLASLQGYLPPAGDGDIIITSQNASWPLAQQISIPVLDAHDATAFLMDRTGDTDAHSADELAKILGYLPLALEQAAAYTVETSCGLKGYAELFTAYQGDLLVRGQLSDYGKTVATTWLAFDQLQQTLPASVTLLRLLACFGPFPIPLNLLQARGEGLLEDVEVAVATQVQALLVSQLTINDSIAALSRYSLISHPARGTVAVHPLVQVVIRGQIPAAQLPAWQDAAAALLRSAMPEDPELPDTWQSYLELTPHALATLPATDMRKVVEFLRHSGSYGAAVVVQEHIVEDVLDRVGPNDPQFVIEMGNLFYMKGESGNPAEARDGFTGLLHGLEHAIDPEAPFTLYLRSQIARWTGVAGDPAEACALFADLLPVLERTLGYMDPRTKMARFNFVSILAESVDPAKARDLYTAMLPAYEEALGPNHPDTLGVRANLAYATGKAGSPTHARQLYAALLPMMDSTLGPAHPKTLIERTNMAYMTAMAGDRAAALDQLAHLLPVYERVHGPAHVSTIAIKEFMERLADAMPRKAE